MTPGKKTDRLAPGLALLLVLLGLGVTGQAPIVPGDALPSGREVHYVEAAGTAPLRGVYAFRETPVTLRDLVRRVSREEASFDFSGPEADRLLSSGARVVFSDGSGRRRVRIERMNAFTRMTLGLPVPVNLASREGLTALPGVGPALAEALAEHRRRTRPFERAEDLLEVRGIGAALLERIQPHIRVP